MGSEIEEYTIEELKKKKSQNQTQDQNQEKGQDKHQNEDQDQNQDKDEDDVDRSPIDKVVSAKTLTRDSTIRSETKVEDHHQTTAKETSNSQEEERSSLDSLGEVSDYWKDGIYGGILATVVFSGSLLFLIAFSVTFISTMFYASLILSVVYVLLVFFEAYYMYLDAKTIKHHSVNNTEQYREKWEPNEYLWGGITLITPPMLDWLPPLFYAYFLRGNRTGVPKWSLTKLVSSDP